MALLQRIALLHLGGASRSSIAEQLGYSERLVAWLMDSDSFKVVLRSVEVA